MSGDVSEFRTLARGLGAAGAAAVPAMRPALQVGAETVKKAWQENARATSGSHGRHYPSSITYDSRVLAASVIAEIGPDSSRPQGSMGAGFEFGSRNQPPHLDGLKAVESTSAFVEQTIDTAMRRLIP